MNNKRNQMNQPVPNSQQAFPSSGVALTQDQNEHIELNDNRDAERQKAKGKVKWKTFIGILMVLLLVLALAVGVGNRERQIRELEKKILEFDDKDKVQPLVEKNQNRNQTKVENQTNVEKQSLQPPSPEINVTSEIEKLLPHEQFQYSNNKNKKQEKSTNLQIGEQYENTKYAQEQELNAEDYHERLAIKLAEFEGDNRANFQDWKILEFEYLKADKNYNFNKVKEELPFCVLVQDDEAIKDRTKILESLSNQNYSNFHIVWIEEPMDNQDGEESLSWPEGRAKNKLRVILNKQQQGTTVNLYFWGRKFCNQDDIILLLGKGTALLGRQVLKILNTVYQSPDVMFTRSSLLLKRSQYDLVSSQIREQQQTLSRYTNKYSKKQGMIQSFRKSLLDQVSIENLLQQKFDNKKTNISSLFYETDFNVFPFYLNIESISIKKSVTLPQFLSISFTPQYNCEKAHQNFIREKGNFTRSLVSTLATEEGDQHSNWATFVQAEKVLRKCLEKYREKIEHHLENPVRVVYGDKIFKRTIYNEKAASKPFAKNPKYTIDLKQFLPNVTNDWRSFSSKQVQSQKDEYYVLTYKEFQPIIRSNRVDFESIKHSIQNQIPFEVLEFEPDPTIEMAPPKLNYEILKTPEQAEYYLNKKLQQLNTKTPWKGDPLYHLAYRMQLFPQQRQVIESEYYYLNKRYNISNQTSETEIPICIISAEYKIINRMNGDKDSLLYPKYFQHLQWLNYTNYHIVYIDDNSPDGSAELIYNYVKNSTMKVKNRMKIVRTLKNMGVTVNLIYWPQKMCGPDQIVIYIDADDNILGRQSLRVFNHLYQDPNTWYAFTRHIKWEDGFWKIRGKSFGQRNIYVRITDYWAVSNTRTFRSNLMRAVPFSQIIEYHYDKKNLIAWPVFQDLSADGIQVSAHVELAGASRIAYYDGFTYGYSGGSGTGCYERIQKYDWRKIMTRTRLRVLDRLDGMSKGTLTQGEPFQEQYYKDAVELSNYLLENKCFRKSSI